MKKSLPIGISDFKKVIEDGYYYVDKSLLIKEIIDSGSETMLFPRPRRFGKTLNLSMLRYFYEKSDKDTGHLFKGLAIAKQGESYLNKQGQHPVIFFTLKDVKCQDWDICFQQLRKLIAQEYQRHQYLLACSDLDQYEKQEFQAIISLQASQVDYEMSLKQLSKWLHRYHGRPTVVLIDEYDTPIQEGYLHGYYDDVIYFMRNFLSGGLKDNSSLEKGILTGILRVAKESIFSGLNHLEVCSLLTRSYSQYFGLLEDEVERILTDYGIVCELGEVKKWYNGYIFGNTVLYNPWSILNYTKNWQDGYRTYWVNSSSNELIKQILTLSSATVKSDLERLLRGETIHKEIDESIIFQNIKKSPKAVWSLLLFCGYLKIVSLEHGKRTRCELAIPNMEIESLYEDVVLSWFETSIEDEQHRMMLEALVNGDVETFSSIFQDFVLATFSMFDTSGKDSEKVYHPFVLVMLLRLQDRYIVKSNRESGYGRYDVMLIPREKNRLGVIIEFKKARQNETLKEAVTAALQQIDEKKYESELQTAGIHDILKLGIAFTGKEVEIEAKA